MPGLVVLNPGLVDGYGNLLSTTHDPVTKTIALNVAQAVGTNLHTVVDGYVNVVQPIGTNLHAVIDSGTLDTITNVVHVDDNNSSLTVDGYVVVSQPTGTNLHTVIDSGSVISGTQVRNASNTWTDVGYSIGDAYMPVNVQNIVPVTGTFWPTTQPVSGTVTVVQPTASSLNATVVGTKTNNNAASDGYNISVLPAVASTSAPSYTNGNLVALSTDLAGSLRIIGTANSQTQVRNSSNVWTDVGYYAGDAYMPISDGAGSITVDTPQLPLSLLGGRLDTNIGSWFGSTAPTVGQKPMSSSVPVVISSDQSPVPITDAYGALTVDGYVYATQWEPNTTSKAWPIKVTNGTYTATVLHNDDGYSSPSVDRLAVNVGFPQVYMKNIPTVIIGQRLPVDYANYVNTFIQNIGSANLIVNGSVTPVVFTFPADAYKDIQLSELRFAITTQDFTFDGKSFGSTTMLTNGVLVEIVAGGVTYFVANIKQNEDWLFYNSPTGVTLNNTGPKDILAMGFFLGDNLVLKAGTSDCVRITIRDNLTGGGANELNYFRAKAFGMKL